MSYILFDVGANWGTDSLSRTKTDSTVITYAFEPTPELAAHLREQSQNFKDRYHCYELAVSDFDGSAIFNIADTPGSDWGCSSLNEFSENLSSFWPGRSDFKFNRSIEVTVTRLDSWFKTNNIVIDKIDFFHCDTQGSDLKVLEGLGDYISLIYEGVIECARDQTSKLYKQNHTLDQAREFLHSRGFSVVKTQPNDPFSNELNLYFKRR